MIEPVEERRELVENPYYQEVQQSLKKKRDQLASQSVNALEAAVEALDDPQLEKQKKKKQDEKRAKKPDWDTLFHIRDKVNLSTQEKSGWSEGSDQSQSNDQMDELRYEETQNLKMDAKQIRRFMGVKIDFKARITELKDLYQYSVVQSRSHNFFLSKFSAFKVGVVGQILSACGLDSSELKALKNEALAEAFSENIQEMEASVYNQELSLVVYGNTKRTRRYRRLYTRVQYNLINKMGQLGRPGYWSDSKQTETRIGQCQKIREEFSQERDDLAYMIQFLGGNTVSDQDRAAFSSEGAQARLSELISVVLAESDGEGFSLEMMVRRLRNLECQIRKVTIRIENYKRQLLRQNVISQRTQALLDEGLSLFDIKVQSSVEA